MFCAIFAVLAAVAAEEPRPRIGLVLSGGGARGAAHVGVLKVLDEMRVPDRCDRRHQHGRGRRRAVRRRACRPRKSRSCCAR